VLLLALVLLGLAAWLGVRGYQAATALQSAADGVRQIRTDLTGGDTAGLGDRARQVAADAARAEAATADPIWRLAQVLPVVGADAVAVRTVAVALDDLTRDALTPLVDVVAALSPAALTPVDGRIELAPLVAAAPVLESATGSAERVQADVDALDPTALHGPLVSPVAELQSELGTAVETLRLGSRLAALLPPMLGTEGPRTYLTLFLNSAELRSQGGIVGAIAMIRAEDGRVELVDQAGSGDLPSWDEPVLPLTDPEIAVATEILGEYVQDTVLIPDTPRAAELTAEMWRRATDQVVDGVVTVDPVALSYVLRATGDVRHPAGEQLSADTLVQTLLFDAYERQSEPSESDAFFASAVAVTFETLAAGDVDPVQLVDAIGQATDERRLSLWSAHPEEQERILGTAVDGALLSGGHDDAVGIFLDNSSGWKTDTFLRTSVGLESASCVAGEAQLNLRLDLTSTLPADSSDLPYYVVGDGSTVPVGTMRMRVSVYTPVDGRVDAVRRGEVFVGAPGATLAGRQVQVMTQSLAGGETASYTFTVTAPAGAADIPLWSTPTTSSPGLTVVPSPCPGE